MTHRSLSSALAPIALLAGCLEPLVSDEVPPAADLLLPPGAEVPDGLDDPSIDHQIAEHDGVAGEVPLLAGFAHGAPIAYWDFGPAPDFAAPIFFLVRRDGESVTQVDHPAIVADVPGTAAYSPYWAVWWVEVTADYQGEVIASAAAIEQAQALGLVRPPVQQPVTVNCPVTASDVTLEVGLGNPALAPTGAFYWDGWSIPYYDFGPMAMANPAIAREAPIYRLRREGGEPLSEPLRQVDMTGDGDLGDTNDIFALTTSDATYTPHSRAIEVVVPATYQSIDSSGDQTVADYRDATDLFDPGPVAGHVIAYQASDSLRNLPQQRTPGGL